MIEPRWSEAEIREALKGHDSYASNDYDEGCGVHCTCANWTAFDLEHVLDVLKASRAAAGGGDLSFYGVVTDDETPEVGLGGQP